MPRNMMAATAALALLASGQAAAFQTPTDKVATATPVKDGTTPEERSNTARLNAEQAARARSDNTIYAQEVSAAQQQVAHDQQVFTDETAVYEAEKARVAAMSAEERIKWEADVAACKAGDTTRCAAPTMPPR